MSKMVLYTRPNCGRCNVVKIKLNQAGADYTIVEDEDKVNSAVKVSGITSAPILKVDDNYYDFGNIIKFIKELS